MLAKDRPGTEVGMCLQSAKKIQNRAQHGKRGMGGNCRSAARSLSVLQAFAERGPVAIAVDDLHVDRGWDPIYED